MVVLNAAILLAVLIVVVGSFYLAQRNITSSGPKTATGSIESQGSGSKTIAKKPDNLPEGLRIKEDDHIWGDINAPVEVVVYDDFECPFCLDFFDTLETAKKEFGDTAVFAFRHYPLPTHLSAFQAAHASECAAEQGKFWEMYAKLFEDNKNNLMDIEEYSLDAKEIGLDTGVFDQCMKTNKYNEKIAKQMVSGKNLGVTGTPTIFVNGLIFPGAYPMDDFTDEQGKTVKGLRNIIKDALGN